MYDKFIKILDDPKLATGIATLLLAAVTWLTRQLSKVPRKFKQRANTIRNQQAIIEGAKRNDILRKLLKTGCIYVHLIRYHNGGGELKKGAAIKLSVDIEKTGISCDKCVTGCRMRASEHPPSLIEQWQNVKITGCWHEIVKKTVINPYDVNHVQWNDLDHEHREIWDLYNIRAYKEIFVMHQRTCFYTIGVSFCHRFTKVENIDGILSMAAKQIANLL